MSTENANINEGTQTDALKSDLPETASANDLVPADSGHPVSRKPKRKFNETKPLDSPEEAIAQFLATPKSMRDFRYLKDLAKYFNISRMTVYRRTKDQDVLSRVAYLLKNHVRAGDLVALRAWPRIVEGQARAAAAGNTKAAQFCKELVLPKSDDVLDRILRNK